MEEKDRKLTLEERLLLIQEIINNGGLYGVNELLNKLSNNKNQLSEPIVAEDPTEEDDTINKTDNSINSAGIYDLEALPLVKADLEEKKQRTGEIEKQPMDKTPNENQENKEIIESKNLVLKQNPWQDLRRVIPNSSEE